jgi:acetyl-CoA carboxylase biotin carboxylase subunit
VQRRHQKIIEEARAPNVDRAAMDALLDRVASTMQRLGYDNLGTVEMLLAPDGEFRFLEMNTRLQVEHPITELVTGVDLVTWQIRIARGERLDLAPRDAVTPRGHAIECRIYAEDPDAGFLPSPGRVIGLRAPDGPGVRDDSGVEPGSEISIYYDPLVSKLVVWGATRAEAIARMTRALSEYEVSGVRTSLPFLRWMLGEPAFARGEFHTGYLDELLQSRRGEPFDTPDLSDAEVAAIAVALRAATTNDALPLAATTGPSHRKADIRTEVPRAGWKATARREGLRG